MLKKTSSLLSLGIDWPWEGQPLHGQHSPRMSKHQKIKGIVSIMI